MLLSVRSVRLKLCATEWFDTDEIICSWDQNRERLDLYYWVLAVLGSVNFMFYMIFARSYKYKRVDKRDVSKDSRSFEWNMSELGLMQKPTLFRHMNSLKAVKEEEHMPDESPQSTSNHTSEPSPVWGPRTLIQMTRNYPCFVIIADTIWFYTNRRVRARKTHKNTMEVIDSEFENIVGRFAVLNKCEDSRRLLFKVFLSTKTQNVNHHQI